LGISEWQTWPEDPDSADVDTVIDECVRAHHAIGIDEIVWNCGRSVLDYRSELPGVTTWADANPDRPHRRLIERVLRSYWPLRRAIELCRDLETPILGRLAMNRHYSGKVSEGSSRFAAEHPEYRERSKTGVSIPHKLCYAIEEVRRERVEILLEIQRIGVDALVLDFCRQIPILMYHDALVEPFREKTGRDPREIESPDPEDHREWWQHRADVLTGFMRTLREEHRRQETELGRPCPIVARVPDNNPWITLVFGHDVERWFAEDLIDVTMLSPFRIVREDPDRHPEYHIDMAHRHGRACVGGIGSLNLMRGHSAPENAHPERYFDPKPVYQLANRQYKAGADAMSLYQSEQLIQLDHLTRLIKELGDRDLVARRARELPAPRIPEELVPLVGCDWHSVRPAMHGLAEKSSHGLLASEAGWKAL
jgi:hypothetical protein